MGGRGPFSFETETVLYGDVWKSADHGATWTKVARGLRGRRHGSRVRISGRLRTAAASS